MVRGMTLLVVLGLGLAVCTATPSADQAAGSHQETPIASQRKGDPEPKIALQRAR